MLKKHFIFSIILLFANPINALSRQIKISSRKISKGYSHTTIVINKILDLSNKIITIMENNILEIKSLKGAGRLILNENSKIILKKNSQLKLKGILFQGTSVKDNFEFSKNSMVIYNDLTGFITEILDDSNPPFTKRPFLKNKYFIFKRDSLY